MSDIAGNGPGTTLSGLPLQARIERRTFGAAGDTVPQVGLGTWPLAGNDGLAGYGALNAAQAEATIRQALASGLAVFDTADVYGDGFAEDLLGRVLSEERCLDAFVITKGGLVPSHGVFDADPSSLRRRAEASLRRLRRDRIDVYLLHNPPPHILGIRSTYMPLLELKERGIVRWVGVSVSHAEHAWLVLDRAEVEVIEVPFNLVNQAADFGVLTHATRCGKAIIVREALAHGLLADRALGGATFPADDFRAGLAPSLITQVCHALLQWAPYRRSGEHWVDFALRFVLDRPEVSTVVVGARHPSQVAALARAGALRHSRG